MQATETIPGYDSFERVALGGMATVYKARKISLDKTVAIKVLYPHLAQDSVYIARFEREARSAARVQHDNIVNVIDYGKSDDSHFIVMEYYDGVTLEDLLDRHPVIPVDVCFAVILNVCYGLESAHSVNLVHRDIKPANVILTRGGGVKIADFGLARATDKLKSVTQHGDVVGTPAYMSPEQTRGGDVGTQSDIFSVGVVAYELACGQRPFDGRNYAEVVNNIQSAEPPPVAKANPLVGERFSQIIGRMLGKELDQRYHSISQTVLDLEEAIDASGYRRDRRTLGRYVEDPARYLESFNRLELERLRVNPPSPADGFDAFVLHHQRVLWLDPADAKSRTALERLNATEPVSPHDAVPDKSGSKDGERRSATYDSDADYKVYLESIDPNQETPATFALKLSMRIRTPLPRVMTIVKNMPAVVGGRLPIRRAKKLAKIIGELGGVARIEVHPIDESTGDHGPKGKDAGVAAEAEGPGGPEADRPDRATGGGGALRRRADVAAAEAGLGKTERPQRIGERASDAGDTGRKSSAAKRTCPKCGWDEDADARFCSMCRFNFNKTEALDLSALQSGIDRQNPLAGAGERSRPRAGLVDRVRDLPASIKYGGLAALIVLLLLIVFGR